MALLGILLTAGGARIATIWLANAALMALMMTRRRGDWPGLMVEGARETSLPTSCPATNLGATEVGEASRLLERAIAEAVAGQPQGLGPALLPSPPQ